MLRNRTAAVMFVAQPRGTGVRRTLQHSLHGSASCEKKHVVLALGMVADALAAHELEPELLLLREAVDAYADWSAHGDELRTRLAAAIIEAKSMLDDEAALVSLP